MPSGSVTVFARRPAVLTVAFLCAAAVWGQMPTTAPTTTQAAETVALTRQRLSRIPLKERTDKDRALLAGLDFVLALGKSDGRRAAILIDAVGYQPLPVEGELPEKPEKPIPPSEIHKLVAGRPMVNVADRPSDEIKVVDAGALRTEFPAVATWMLPQDWAVVFRAASDGHAGRWITRDACIVVRIRADRPTILGGNLLEVLAAAAEAAAPPGEEK